ncbi:hypothetical protein CHUAL_000509 [Chamberlinius hualienensis]
MKLMRTRLPASLRPDELQVAREIFTHFKKQKNSVEYEGLTNFSNLLVKVKRIVLMINFLWFLSSLRIRKGQRGGMRSHETDVTCGKLFLNADVTTSNLWWSEYSQ